MGLVEEVHLSDDRSHVVVEISMNDRAESMLSEDTRFWVVRPRLRAGLSAVQAGLKTLVSGAYIAMDPGKPSGKAASSEKKHYKGLEEPPSVRSDQPGTVYFLDADRLGKLGAGAPIQYRDITVGEVLSHELDDDGPGVRLRIFVRSPFDEKVVRETRFWRAQGITVENDADGLNIQLESARVLLSGGVAFDTPQSALRHPPSPPRARFALNESEALARTDFFEGIPYVSYFQSSVRGLSVGSEVNMFGRRVGSVTDISLEEHEDPGPFAVRVAYVLQPERVFSGRGTGAFEQPNIMHLVEEDLRVVLQTTSFVTGEKALALDYVPAGEPAPLQREGEALVLPAESRDVLQITSKLAKIANDVGRIPFAAIGDHLNQTLLAVETTVKSPEMQHAVVSLDATLTEAEQLVREARAGMEPALERLPIIAEKMESAVDEADRVLSEGGLGADSTLQRNLERMTGQIAEAAQSVRLLADYLNRHPEALVRGRKGGEE